MDIFFFKTRATMHAFNNLARGQLANFRVLYRGVTIIVVAAHVDVVFIENPYDTYFDIILLLYYTTPGNVRHIWVSLRRGVCTVRYIHAEENTCSHFNHTCNIVLILYGRVPCRKLARYNMDTSFFGGHRKCQVKIYVPKCATSRVHLL